MTHSPFPTVAAYPLPTFTSAAARNAFAAQRVPAETPAAEVSDDRDSLVQAVSDAIARRARQRRYTP